MKSIHECTSEIEIGPEVFVSHLHPWDGIVQGIVRALLLCDQWRKFYI